MQQTQHTTTMCTCTLYDVIKVVVVVIAASADDDDDDDDGETVF